MSGLAGTDKAEISSTAFDKRDLRNALGRFPTGVAVVTAKSGDGIRAGVTVNSFCSVSLDPPLVLWCLAKNAPSWAVFEKAEYFAVHILAEAQSDLSTRFSRPMTDKFSGLALAEGLGGTPLLEGVAALFECRTRHCHDGGDHHIIIGEVARYDYAHHAPLVFHSGDYSALFLSPD